MMRKLKGREIYLPKGTSEWVGITDPVKMMRVTITSGGGMGGSRWERYIEPTHFKEGLNKVKDINTGEVFMINSTYIVEIHTYDLYTCEYLCTNPNFNMVNELCSFQVYTNEGNDVILNDKVELMDEWCYRN